MQAITIIKSTTPHISWAFSSPAVMVVELKLSGTIRLINAPEVSNNRAETSAFFIGLSVLSKTRNLPTFGDNENLSNEQLVGACDSSRCGHRFREDLCHT